MLIKTFFIIRYILYFSGKAPSSSAEPAVHSLRQQEDHLSTDEGHENTLPW